MLGTISLAALALLFASVVLASVERIRLGGISTVPRLDPDPAPLRLAAELAYGYVKDKRLPLAAVAERKGHGGDAVSWFEHNMLRAIPVSATSTKTGIVKELGSFTRTGMYVVPDGIAKSADGEPVYRDPTVTAKDFKAYMAWTRTVW